MNIPHARACLAALATAGLCGATALAAAPAGAAVAAAPDISQGTCTAKTFTVVYDNSTKRACYSGTGRITVAIPEVDKVQTGVNSGSFTAKRAGSTAVRQFSSGTTIVLSPANVWEITVIDITRT